MDVRELKDKASQLFTKGKFSKAAEAYEEYCATDKKDHLARLRCGDAWSKAGKKDKAIHAYSLAAEGFARDGFLPRAIAASKLVLEIDPNHKAVQTMLANLYAQKRGPAPSTKASVAPAARAAPAPEVTRAVEAPGTAAGFTKRREAIELDAPVPQKAAPARPETPLPSPGERPDAIELPDYEIPIETSAAPVAATGHKQTSRTAAIELEVGAGAASAAPAALVETSIEIELSAGQPVTGEVEIPIEGQPLPDADQLPAELQVPATALAAPIDPLAAPAPSAPIFDLTVEADAPAPAAQPSAVYDLSDEVPAAAVPLPAPSAPTYDLTDEVPAASAPQAARPPPAAATPVYDLSDDEPAPSTSGVYDLSDEVPQGAPAQASAAPGTATAAPSSASPLPPSVAAAPPPPAVARLTTPLPPSIAGAPQASVAVAPSASPLPPAVAAAPPPPAVAPAASTPLPPEVGAAPPPPGIAPVKPAEASLPPGLRPRRAPEASPAAPASRIWIPPAFTAPAPDAQAPLSASGPAAESASGDDAASTDLERGLQAFMQFDPDAAAPAPAPAPRPATPAPAASFTELDLEGDSLLHAVEAAAAAVVPTAPAVSEAAEEAMEAPEEPRLEAGGLPKIPLFSDLPEDAFIALFERCPLQRFDSGQLVFEQGDKADAFYVICGGKTRVFRVEDGKRRELASLDEGSFFGELALLSEAPRSASVEAAEDDTQVLVISAEVLRELSTAHPAVATALKKFSRQRMLTNLMNNAALFAPFSRGDRRDLVQKFRARDVPRGEVLVREGQVSDGLYVVLYGEVEVVAKGRTLATLREGQVFGEMSLLQRTPAGATVRATRHTSLLRLPKGDFDSLILSHPQVLEHVAELVDERTKANASSGML